MTRQTILLRPLAALCLASSPQAQAASQSTLTMNVYSMFILCLLILSSMLAWRLYQRQRADAALLAALDTAGLALLTLDNKLGILRMNKAFQSLPGVPAQAHSLSEFPSTWKTWLSSHALQALEHDQSSAEDRLLSPSDEQPATLLRLSAARLRDANGAPGILLWCENLTAGSATVNAALGREHTLRTRTQRFIQTLIDVIPRPVYVKDESGRYLLANAAFCSTHGIEHSALIGQRAGDIGLRSLEAPAIALEDARVMAGAPIFKEEFSSNPDQPESERFTIISKQTCIDPEGRHVLVGTTIDITPWRIAERELQASLKRETERRQRIQAFVQRLIDVIPHPVYVKNPESRYLLVNDAFVREQGRPREELLGHTPMQVAHLAVATQPELEAEVERRARQSRAEDLAVLAGTPSLKEENDTRALTGAPRDRIISKAACEDPYGQHVIVGAMFDITELRNTQRELTHALQIETRHRERTVAFIQRLIDAIPLPICVRDQDSCHLHVNAAFLADSGLQREQIIGRRITDFVTDPAQIAVSQREDREVLAGGAAIFEEKQDFGLNGQRLRNRIISKRRCLDVDDQPVLVVAHIDVTAQRQLEAAIQRSKVQPMSDTRAGQDGQ